MAWDFSQLSLSGSLCSAILIQASRELAKWLVSVPSSAGDGVIIKEVLWKWPYWGEQHWKRGSNAANFRSAICQGSQECVMPGERTDVQPGIACQIRSLLSVHTFLWDPIGLLWSNNRLFSLTSSNFNAFVDALAFSFGVSRVVLCNYRFVLLRQGSTAGETESQRSICNSVTLWIALTAVLAVIYQCPYICIGLNYRYHIWNLYFVLALFFAVNRM